MSASPLRLSNETAWKLVEAKCSQLSEAVNSARVPFILATTWALIWAWSLYSSEFGYSNTYRSRYIDFYNASKLPSRQAEFENLICPRLLEYSGDSIYRGFTSNTSDEKQKVADAAVKKDIDLRRCKAIVKERLAYTEKQYLETQLISFPWGFGKINITDLGIVGNLALILILLWLFYSTRRENHSVRSFVDMTAADRLADWWLPRRFRLESKGQLFSAEQMSYSYHSVSQRFVFVFSSFSRPLYVLTTLLIIVPLLVSCAHLLTDLRDVISQPFEKIIYFRVSLETLLFVAVFWVTIRIVRYCWDTSLLLNAWSIAVRDVWLDDANDNELVAAPAVDIDTLRQVGSKA